MWFKVVESAIRLLMGHGGMGLFVILVILLVPFRVNFTDVTKCDLIPVQESLFYGILRQIIMYL